MNRTEPTIKDKERAAPFYLRRLERARQTLGELDLDALLIGDIVNISYLTRFGGSTASLLITPDEAELFVDARYVLQARAETVGVTPILVTDPIEGLSDALDSAPLKRIGFEAGKVSVESHARLRDKFDSVEWVQTSRLIERIRLLKDPMELEAIESLVAIIARSFDEIVETARAGMTEKAFSVEIEYILKRAGADKAAFDFIVASGARSAMPHAIASEKIIEPGDIIKLDFGVVGLRGYHTDITRLIALGAPRALIERIYKIALEANRLAIDAIRPGVMARDIDFIARDHIRRNGFGDHFGHSLGHGVGLAIHEAPRISALSKDIIEEGMVFTIEPGIYIDGVGGARIEDMVYVESNRARALTRAIPKEFFARASR